MKLLQMPNNGLMHFLTGSAMAETTDDIPIWDYKVAVQGIDYTVRIDDNHRVLSVARLAQTEFTWADGSSRPRQIIWHLGMLITDAPMPREVSRVIQAARVIEKAEREP
jgi:hypothetical protein